jgi:hypothetical protein
MAQYQYPDNRQRNIRIILTIIIMATIPFYCIGFALYLFAPQSSVVVPTPTVPTGDVVTATPTPTTEAENITPSPPTADIPTAFVPPTLRPLSPTPLFPTATLFIPTQPPVPTSTFTPQPLPPTATTLPIFPTDTTIPFGDSS